MELIQDLKKKTYATNQYIDSAKISSFWCTMKLDSHLICFSLEIKILVEITAKIRAKIQLSTT